jgi:hypothetical protein
VVRGDPGKLAGESKAGTHHHECTQIGLIFMCVHPRESAFYLVCANHALLLGGQDGDLAVDDALNRTVGERDQIVGQGVGVVVFDHEAAIRQVEAEG